MTRTHGMQGDLRAVVGRGVKSARLHKITRNTRVYVDDGVICFFWTEIALAFLWKIDIFIFYFKSNRVLREKQNSR